VKQAPSSRLTRLMAAFSSKALYGRLLDPQKLVDDLGRRPEIPVVGSSTASPLARQQAADVISTYMHRAGVKPRVIEQRLGELSQIKTRSDFFDLVEKKIFGKGGDIDQHLHKNVDPSIRDRIINLHDTAVEGRTRSMLVETAVVDGKVIRYDRPVLGREVAPGEYVPLPDRPTAFLQHLRLPDVELLIEADSFIRRGVSTLERKGGFLGKTAALPYRVPQFVLKMSQLILKPAVLLPRQLGAMPLRIQLEQAARSSGYGYKPFKGIPQGITLFPGGIPVPLGHGVRVAKSLFGENGWRLLDPDPRFEGMSSPDASDMGMFASEAMDGAPGERVWETSPRRDEMGRPFGKIHSEAYRQTLADAHNDFVLRKLAALELDEEAFLKWMKTDDAARRFLDTDLKPQLARAYPDKTSDDATRVWAQRQIEYLKQVTKEQPKYLRTIATGRTRSTSGGTPDFGPDGKNILAKYDAEVHRYDIIRAALDDKVKANAGRSEIAALQNEQKIALRTMARMERENPNLHKVKSVKLDDKRRWKKYVEDEWRNEQMELPDKLLVEHRRRAAHDDGGTLDDIERAAEAISNAQYRHFGVLTYADKHGTRGSLFTQAYARQRHLYLKRGLEPKTADAMAYARAGEITKDLMYDLSARTSTQRALSGLMWFAPAWQEVLYTWLVKMPSESYWPVGMVSTAAKAAGLLETLKGVGVIQEDSEGADIIVVPGLATVLEKMTGGYLKIPEVVYGKATGLNVVATGGGPGLSTPASWGLGEAALRYGGVFKDLSDLLQPYGPDTSLLPSPIKHIWEAAMGSPLPMFSPEREKADYDRSFDFAIQYAYAELQASGATPPRPEKYAKKGKDGEWEPLTVEQQEKYRKANFTYLTDLMDLAKRYQRGIASVRAIGSTVAPMSLYVTSKEREGWDEFWNEVIVPKGFGDQGLSDAQRDLIDDYIDDHPESFAYSVFYRGQGTKDRDLPFPESIDDAFYERTLTGESTTLEPKEYAEKLLATESRRYYQSQLDSVLRSISPTNNPWEFLTQGFEKKQALSDYNTSWDRYRQLNPEAAALLDKQSALWKKNNDVPVRGFEVERLSQLNELLREVAPMLTGETGIRPDYLKQTMNDVAILLSDRYDGGPPNTPQEKALEWYFDKVYIPKAEQVSKLYEQAELLSSQNLPASHIYNKIREIYDAPMPKYKGQVVPQMEAVSFGNRSPEEREAAILSWQSRPITWLSDFQLETAGYNVTPEAKKFLRDVAQYDEEMWNYINDSGIHPASTEYDDIRAKRIRDLGAEAQRLGVTDIWNLNEAAPAFRLASQGFGEDVAPWQSIISSVRTITSRIQTADLSPRGFGEMAKEQKIYLYQAISNARQDNQALDKLFIKLSHSFPLDDGYRLGASLYEAVFFGNFRHDDIPYDVSAAAYSAD
jgi:hypothetical protein